MRRRHSNILMGCLGFLMLVNGQPVSEAYTSKGQPVIIGASGTVKDSTAFTATVVRQSTTRTEVPAIDFGAEGNNFRDSEEAIEVNVDTNVAQNRVIIYTNNSSETATPRYQGNPSTGIDGGGLVGMTDPSMTVPLVWSVTDTLGDYTFDAGKTDGDVGDGNEIYVTDVAHTASFTPKGSALDQQPMERCADHVSVHNTPNDGLYPQFFGASGQDFDLCKPGTTEVVAQELSKNISVVAFGFVGTKGLAPNLETKELDAAVEVTSPIYLPIGADFQHAMAQEYRTSTLTVELVTQ